MEKLIKFGNQEIPSVNKYVLFMPLMKKNVLLEIPKNSEMDFI